MEIRNLRQLNTLLLSAYLVFLISGCQQSKETVSSPYSIVYSSKESKNRAIYLSDEEGKSRLMVTSFTLSDGYPAVSPDGKRIAFYGKYDDYKTWSIHAVDVDGNNMKRLTDVKNVWDSAPSWSLDGKEIVFSREYKDLSGVWQEEIWLMNADGSDQRQIKVLEGRAAQFMQDGRLLFQSKTGPSQICMADIDGSNVIKLTNTDTNNRSPKVSPDGKQIAFLSNRDGNQEVYTMNIDGSNQKRVTFNGVEDWDPAWSADGSKLFFISENDNGFFDVYKMNKDGSSPRKILNNGSQVSTVKNLNKTYLERLISEAS